MLAPLLLALSAVLSDPLEWLYPDSSVASVVEFAELDVPMDGLVQANVLLNELTPGEEVELSVSVPGGEWSAFESVPVEFNTGPAIFAEKPGETNEFVVRRAPYRVFDALRPLTPVAHEASSLAVFVPTSSVAAAHFTIEASRLDALWPYLDFSFRQGDSRASQPLVCRVHPVTSRADSPDRAFAYVNWMSFSNMAERHGLEPWSESHWAMIDRYLALAARNRQNAVWLPYHEMFDRAAEDAPLDILATNRLDRLLSLIDRHGIRWIEGGHLFARGEGGWKCTNLVVCASGQSIDDLAAHAELVHVTEQLNAFIHRHHLESRWYQHVVDEPQPACAAAFNRACGLTRRLMPGVPLIDAARAEGMEGALDILTANVWRYVQNPALFQSARTNSAQRLWLYTCCAPGGKWMNRLLDQELLRPVYLFTAIDAIGGEGYLHWGYNHWQDGQDPFKMSCITNWGGNAQDTLPAGDTHVVYPGPDGPWPSIRLEATRIGMEDVELFRRLRTSSPALAELIRAKTIRDFGDYEKDVRAYRKARRELMEGLELVGDSARVTFSKPALRWLWGGFGFHHAEASMTPLMTQEFLNERVLKSFREISPSYARVFAGHADWTREAMDAWADYYDRTFREAHTVLYLVPGRLPPITADFDAEAYAEQVAANLDYLVNTRDSKRIRYYAVSNELSVGNRYAWFQKAEKMDLYAKISAALYRAFRRHGLLIGLQAPDTSGLAGLPAIDWTMEHMDDLTETYCWHAYLRDVPPGDLRLYDSYFTPLTNLVARCRRLEKRVSLGEYGVPAPRGTASDVMRTDVGFSFADPTNAPIAALARAEIALAALNAGCESAVNWTFCDYPDPFLNERDMVSRFSGHGTSIRYNKWGLFRWSDDERDYRAYPDLYTMGPLVRYFRRGSRVLAVDSTDPALRVGGVTNPDGSSSLAFVNLGPAKSLHVTLPPTRPEIAARGFRQFLYRADCPPQNAFNDLPPPVAVRHPLGDALTLQLPAKSFVLLTSDFVDRVPPEVEGVEISRERLVWEPVDDPDHAYYRVFTAAGEQIHSTVATWCEVPDLEADYIVKSVDRWGNIRN